MRWTILSTVGDRLQEQLIWWNKNYSDSDTSIEVGVRCRCVWRCKSAVYVNIQVSITGVSQRVSQSVTCNGRQWSDVSPKKREKMLHRKNYFYRTRVRSLGMLVSDSLTNWLTDSLLFSGLDGCEWFQLLDDVAKAIESCENLLRLLLFLMLVMRIVLSTVCCRFGSWGLVKKLNFYSDFEHKVWSRFWSWN